MSQRPGSAPQERQSGSSKLQRALFGAIDQLNPGEVERLLAEGASPDQPSYPNRDTPLLAACSYNPEEPESAREIVGILARWGAKLGPGVSGWSALSVACYNGMPKMVDLLLSLGSDPSAARDACLPPLAQVALNGGADGDARLAIAGALLRAGADLERFKKGGDLDLALDPISDNPAGRAILSALEARELGEAVSSGASVKPGARL